jgi:flagellar hook-associated protein 2
VDQDAPATTTLVKAFVDTFNQTLDAIEAQTKADPKNPGTLAGDSSLGSLESSLRSMVTDIALGATGKYRSLADIGVSTGPTGSAVGTTDRLKLDEAKLTAALKDNPQAVASVLASSLGAAGAPSGVGNVTIVEGSPTSEHEDGTYHVNVTDATTGAVEVRFVTTDGRELMKRTGVLTPNTQNSTLIPGLKLTVGATLTAGEDTFSLSATNRGVMVRMQDRLDNLLDAGKYFDSRNDASEAISKQLSDQIATMQTRLDDKEAALNRKFTALEAAMAQLQSQSSALLSQIAKLGDGQSG